MTVKTIYFPQLKITTLFILLLSFTVFFLSACEPQSTPKKKSKSRTLPWVEVSQIQKKSLNHHITLSGTLKAKRSINLYNQTPGVLIKLPFYESDQVKKGDLIAQLEDIIIRTDFNKANANLKQATIDFKRLQKLASSNHASKELLAHTKTQVTLAQAEFTLQKKRLSYTKIHAPWNGVISERLVEPGDVLALYTHFATMIDTSSLRIDISLSELYLSQINLHDSITYTIDALNQAPQQGEIIRIFPQINPQTRKGIIEILLASPNKNARPGQLARVTLATKKQDVLVTPLSSVRYDQHGAYVFIARKKMIDNKPITQVTRTNIQTGQEYPQYIEVLSGLNVGDLVVKKGLFGLHSAKQVRMVNTSDKKK